MWGLWPKTDVFSWCSIHMTFAVFRDLIKFVSVMCCGSRPCPSHNVSSVRRRCSRVYSLSWYPPCNQRDWTHGRGLYPSPAPPPTPATWQKRILRQELANYEQISLTIARVPDGAMIHRGKITLKKNTISEKKKTCGDNVSWTLQKPEKKTLASAFEICIQVIRKSRLWKRG